MKLPTIDCETEQDIIDLNAAVEERFNRHFHAIPDWSLVKDLSGKVGPGNLMTLIVGFLRDVPEGAHSVRDSSA